MANGATIDLSTLTRRTRRLKIVLVLLILITAAMLPFGFHQAVVRDAIPSVVQGNLDPATLLLAVQSLLGILAIFNAMSWLRRAAETIRALGAKGLTVTPGMAVWWFFIPIANLFMPYRAVSELWRASVYRAAWASHTASGLIGFWWGFHLATMFSFDQFTQLDELTFAAARFGITLQLPPFLPYGELLLIIALMLLYRIVDQIHAGQQHWLRDKNGYHGIHGIEVMGAD